MEVGVGVWVGSLVAVEVGARVEVKGWDWSWDRDFLPACLLAYICGTTPFVFLGKRGGRVLPTKFIDVPGIRITVKFSIYRFFFHFLHFWRFDHLFILFLFFSSI